MFTRCKVNKKKGNRETFKPIFYDFWRNFPISLTFFFGTKPSLVYSRASAHFFFLGFGAAFFLGFGSGSTLQVSRTNWAT